MSKSTWLKIFAFVVTVGGAAATAATAGVLPAVIAGAAAASAWMAGLNHPTPAATKAFGPEAK